MRKHRLPSKRDAALCKLQADLLCRGFMDFGIALTLGATALGLVARFTLPGLQVGVIARATSLFLATWLLVVLPAYAGSQPPSAEVAAIDVRSYSARIEPDLARGSLHGQVRIDLRVLTAAPELEFDAGELVIDAVREDGVALPFAMEGGRLRITLPRAARPGERHALDIGYHGTPRFGLQFQPQRGELYTIFSTDQWLVCINAPRERATLDLSVVLPADVTAVGNGRALPVRRLADGRSLHRWRQSVPVPSYVYGFAAGRTRRCMGAPDPCNCAICPWTWTRSSCDRCSPTRVTCCASSVSAQGVRIVATIPRRWLQGRSVRNWRASP
ncbi:hypothetical protein [Lysobacter sp. FW306-1B-D06B]|uniref:hypothetical protein n=1 Tax=Lysobacter sp. FW306-1B-D06B TaxID=3140250 RepID=UPI00313FF1E5